jgi:hypothetical protein
MDSPQQRLFLHPETRLYRALTSGKCIGGDGKVTDFAFRLRPANENFPAETALSVASSPELAMNALTCKGYTVILLGDIEKIDGLSVRAKEGDDEGCFEIIGIPPDNVAAQNDYGLALAKISGPPIIVKKR